MITQLSDYKFITGNNVDATHPNGDLNRIIINGGIMPLRPYDNYDLRGEDVTFLLEAVGERLQATFYRYDNVVDIDYIDTGFTRASFTKDIDSSMVAHVTDEFRYRYGTSSHKYDYWIDEDGTGAPITEGVYDCTDNNDKYNWLPSITFNQTIVPESYWDSISRYTPHAGDAITKSPINSIFYYLQYSHHFLVSDSTARYVYLPNGLVTGNVIQRVEDTREGSPDIHYPSNYGSVTKSNHSWCTRDDRRLFRCHYVSKERSEPYGIKDSYCWVVKSCSGGVVPWRDIASDIESRYSGTMLTMREFLERGLLSEYPYIELDNVASIYHLTDHTKYWN